MPTERRYEHLFGVELQERIAERPLAWLPLGPLEKHGNHLPWGLDGAKAHMQCLRLAVRFGGVVLPPIHIAGIHDPWHNDPETYRRLRAEVGDFYLTDETLTRMVTEVIEGLANIGFKIIVLNTGHYPAIQGELLRKIAPPLEQRLGVTIIAFDEDVALGKGTVDHAGVFESSMHLALGQVTHLDRAKPEHANRTGYFSANTPPYHASFDKGLAWLHRIEAWFDAKFKTLGLDPLPREAADQTVPGLYRHYKGNHYRVLSLARHSETQEELVVYRALYGDHGVWVRPAAMFRETVQVNGKTLTRFELLAIDHDPL